jgi:hypothetical protein
MPIGNRHSAGTIWLPTGNPDTTNISSDDMNSSGGQPGGVGLIHESGAPGRTYQRVKLDSGATASTPAGAVSATHVAYWKDPETYVVTNDSRFALNGASNVAYRNAVAGIFRNSATAGYYIDVIQKGTEIPCADGGNSFTAGYTIIAEADTAASAVNSIAPGSALTSQPLGVARGAAANNVVLVDLDISGQE